MDEKGVEESTRNEKDIAERRVNIWHTVCLVFALIELDAYRLPDSNVCESVTIAKDPEEKEKKNQMPRSRRVHTAINFGIYCLFAAVKNEFEKLVVVAFVVVRGTTQPTL